MHSAESGMTRTWSCKSTRKCKDLSGEKERKEGNESHRQLHEEHTQPTCVHGNNAQLWSFWRLLLVRMSEFACKRQRCGILTRIRASMAANTSWLAEIHLKYTCCHRFGKGSAKSPTSLPLSLSLTLSLSLVSFAFAPLCVLYTHSGCKKTESQFEDKSLENSRGVAGNNIRCFLVGGESIQKAFLLFSAQSPALPEIPQRFRKSVASVERIQNQPPIKVPLLCKISSKRCASRANPAAAEVPQLRPVTCGGLRHLARVIF